MGVSSDGLLVYGFNLGGPDDGWLVKEADEYGELHVPWYATSDGVDDDFTETVENALSEAGVQGIVVITHCSHEYPMYILAADDHRAWRGSPVILDVSELTPAPEWNPRLHKACEVLGLTPDQEEPNWILASLYG